MLTYLSLVTYTPTDQLAKIVAFNGDETIVIQIIGHTYSMVVNRADVSAWRVS